MSSSRTHERRTAGACRDGVRRRRRAPGAAAAAAVAVGLLACPAQGAAQQETNRQERCDLMESERVRSILTGDGGRIAYVSGPALFACDDATRIRADSAVMYTATRFRELIGGVEIDGPETRVRADRIHLSTGSGRTQAWGDVRVLEKGAGTRMVGDTLVLLRAGELRERDELRMWGGRPYAVLRIQGEEAPDTVAAPEPSPDSTTVPEPTVEPPAEAQPPPPDTVFGDRLYMEGRRRFLAAGSVRIRRSALEAFGDSLDYARDGSRALLLGRDTALARIEGDDYDLEGRELDLRMRGSRVSEVRAAGRARVTGRDVRIDAPRIRVYLANGDIERLVAVRALPTGDGETADSAGTAERAVALAEDIVLRADSIEVEAPGQSPERVFAVGGARGETLGRDSLNTAETPDLIRRDWIEGDTVVAHFRPADSLAAVSGSRSGDVAGARARLDRLVARGNARSLYRLTREDSATGPGPDTASAAGAPEVADPATPPSPDSAAAPEGAGGGGAPDAAGAADEEPGGTPGARSRLAVHYVVGDRITIVLREGEVEHMEVLGQTRGLYLEPRRGSPEPAPPSDSAAGPPAGPAPEGPGRAPTGGDPP